MKKRILCFTVMIMSVLIFSCTNDKKEVSENRTIISNNEVPIISTNVIEKEEAEVELITVERFMELYDLTSEDLGDFNLQAMITYYQLTEENMKGGNWKAMVEYDIADDVHYECNISDVIYGTGRTATIEDDIAGMKLMVMLNEVGMSMDGLSSYQNIIWDIDNKKCYYGQGDFSYDYTKADINRELTEEQINQMISGLVDMNMPEWDRYCEGGETDTEEFEWNVYVVLENGDCLAYSGEKSRSGNPEGFVDWLEEVIRVSGGE